MNMLGKCVLLKEHISTEELISGETLSPGIYVLECFNGEKWMQVKLLKEGDQK